MSTTTFELADFRKPSHVYVSRVNEGNIHVEVKLLGDTNEYFDFPKIYSLVGRKLGTRQQERAKVLLKELQQQVIDAVKAAGWTVSDSLGFTAYKRNANQQDGVLSERYERMKQDIPELENLWNKLLSLGGREVVFWSETSAVVAEVLQKGSLWSTTQLEYIAGEPSQCHENVMKFVTSHKGNLWICGYALSDDGLWRSHSWIWDTKREILLETTVKREQYFGFPVLEKDQILLMFSQRPHPQM